ncbi:MAG: carboxypeptidase-like regulatory domain-containing protein [Gemmatimonadota bacterium]
MPVRVVSTSGEVIPAAIVQLHDSEGRIVAERLTDDNGRATLSAPAAGTYRVLVDRLGHEEWTSPPFEVRGPPDAVLEFAVPVRPVAIDPLMVDVNRKCPVPRGQGPLITRMHIHTRNALAKVTDGTREEDLEFVLESRTERPVLDKDRKIARVDTVRVKRPLMSPPPDMLALDGYVVPRTSPDELPRFYAPAPDVLLAESFVTSHCFAVREHEDSAWTGLYFQPLPDAENYDVKGVVWVDTLQVRPVMVEWDYTELDRFLRVGEYPLNSATLGYRQNAAATREHYKPLLCDTYPNCLSTWRLQLPSPRGERFRSRYAFAPAGDDLWFVWRWRVVWPALYRLRPTATGEKSKCVICSTVPLPDVIQYATIANLLPVMNAGTVLEAVRVRNEP